MKKNHICIVKNRFDDISNFNIMPMLVAMDKTTHFFVFLSHSILLFYAILVVIESIHFTFLQCGTIRNSIYNVLM